MAYGEHHLWAYDPEIGRSREFTAEELENARGRGSLAGAEAVPILGVSEQQREQMVRLDEREKCVAAIRTACYGSETDLGHIIEIAVDAIRARNNT